MQQIRRRQWTLSGIFKNHKSLSGKRKQPFYRFAELPVINPTFMNFNRAKAVVPLSFSGLSDPAGKNTLGAACLFHASNVFSSAIAFPVTHKRDFLGLHFNLGTRVHYIIDGVSYCLRPRQYALLYMPSASYQCEVEPGKSETFSIHLSVRYLQHLENHFPILCDLLQNTRQRRFFPVSKKNLECTTEMRKKINEILHNDWTGICWETFMNVRVLEILLSCLTNITICNTGAKKHPNLPKLESVRKYLSDHLTERFSADLVADKMKMDKHKLRKDFKAVYKITMQEFILEERLKKARAFLRDSKMPVNKIAASVGYKKLSNFTDLFKKRYGYPPSALRGEFRI
jgi:AraC-like DNA-binding protein